MKRQKHLSNSNNNMAAAAAAWQQKKQLAACSLDVLSLSIWDGQATGRPSLHQQQLLALQFSIVPSRA